MKTGHKAFIEIRYAESYWAHYDRSNINVIRGVIKARQSKLTRPEDERLKDIFEVVKTCQEENIRIAEGLLENRLKQREIETHQWHPPSEEPLPPGLSASGGINS